MYSINAEHVNFIASLRDCNLVAALRNCRSSQRLHHDIICGTSKGCVEMIWDRPTHIEVLMVLTA